MTKQFIATLAALFAFSCAPAVAMAQTATIDTTGPGSTNTIEVDNTRECEVTNTNNVDVTNNNSQSSSSGSVDASNNTTVGSASSGNASNSSSTSTNVSINNGNGCAAQVSNNTVEQPAAQTPGRGADTSTTPTAVESASAIAMLPETGSSDIKAKAAIASAFVLSGLAIAGLPMIRKALLRP